ncbi:MAG: alginate lyase family protein, partial [Armatimonadota bacterium]
MVAHPFLFATPHQLDTAKQNIARYDWANRVYIQLKADADKLAEMELPQFETAWWQEAKKKPWHEIYPEINHHTSFAVRPAIYAAFQSAVVYRLGGEEVYAERAKRVLLHYTNYKFIFIHPDVGLNYAGWGLHALWTYDLLHDCFTPAERKKIDDFFNRWLKAVVENDEWWVREGLGGRFNNHFTWHKLTMAAYGLFYNKPEWVRRAFDSEQGIRQ